MVGLIATIQTGVGDPHCVENCSNGVDDDGDHDTDCNDDDCIGFDPVCGEVCADGVDNNGDGHVDCDDPYCFVLGVCGCTQRDPELQTTSHWKHARVEADNGPLIPPEIGVLIDTFYGAQYHVEVQSRLSTLPTRVDYKATIKNCQTGLVWRTEHILQTADPCKSGHLEDASAHTSSGPVNGMFFTLGRAYDYEVILDTTGPANVGFWLWEVNEAGDKIRQVECASSPPTEGPIPDVNLVACDRPGGLPKDRHPASGKVPNARVVPSDPPRGRAGPVVHESWIKRTGLHDLPPAYAVAKGPRVDTAETTPLMLGAEMRESAWTKPRRHSRR